MKREAALLRRGVKFPVLCCSQRGLTLVELMVAITVGMFLVAGLAVLIAQQSGTRTTVENGGRLIENGRYAAQLMGEDIQHAGYYGELVNLTAPPATLPDPCVTTVADMADAMPLHVQGYDNPVAALSCVASRKSGTDVLVVRRADGFPLLATAAVANTVYLQTGLGVSGLTFEKVLAVPAGTTPYTLKKKDKVTPALVRKYLVNIYYVRSCREPTGSGGVCQASDDGGNPIPTLVRVELGAGPAWVVTPLVEGIENMQIDYGLDIPPTAAATDVDGAPDLYTTGTYSVGTTAMTTNDWANVVAVKIHLLARSVEQEAGYQDAKSYNMGLAGAVSFTAAADKPYTRHVFTQQVRLVNPSARRSQ